MAALLREPGLNPILAGEHILARAGDAFTRRLDPRSSAPLAIGVSGGGDSLALLLAAAAWSRRVGRGVLALSVDHGVQPAGALWSRDICLTAASLGVEARILRWTDAKPSTGLPAAARAARHRLLADAARGAGARVLLLGHTRDDVEEGVLMRQEGSTLGTPQEWAPSPAWPEGRDLFLLRPLLGMGRAELRVLLADSGLPWIEDPANDDLKYARARARRALEGARRRTALEPHPLRPSGPPPPHAGEDDLAALAIVHPSGMISIPRDALISAPPDAARRFLMMACLCAGGGERPPRGERAAALLARIAAGEAFTATLAGARVAAGDEVLIAREAGEAERGGLTPLRLPVGEPVVWDGRFAAVAAVEGLTIAPLRGQAARLPAAERERLKKIPALARPGLPVILSDGELVTCPMLAWSAQARLRRLVGRRLLAACSGSIASESQL